MKNESYQEAMLKNEAHERNRIYCLHDFSHQLDVARITYIMSLEKGLNVKKEVIYATALLHDIGRYVEYEGIMPHHEASARIAKKILEATGYEKEEIRMIVETILNHRNKMDSTEKELDFNTNAEFSKLFYQADKLSRNCFTCQASATCKWPQERRNKEIIL